jgi:hypothetical protein
MVATNFHDLAHGVDLWTDTIVKARATENLCAIPAQAARWEEVHRKLANRLRMRAALYQPGVSFTKRTHALNELLCIHAYEASQKGGFGRRAMARDIITVVGGTH